MQTVERITPNELIIMGEVEAFYAYVSEPSKRLVAPTFDSSFKKLGDVFNEYSEYSWKYNFTDKVYEKVSVPSDNRLILTFSGGKDSIATALKYKAQGYDVRLYHMKHINPSFSDEWESAVKAAELLELPIFIDDIKFHGHHMWMEHPMKNMIIANGALSYGIREGIGTRLAFGNYTTSFLEDNAFDRCAGDCVDMWEAYINIIRRQVEDFEVISCITNMTETLEVISKRPDLFDASLSCLCRHSLRDYRKSWVLKKFGVDLPEKRCGSCYKCAIEYIYRVDHDLVELNEGYYKYCLNQLYRNGISMGERATTLPELWDDNFDYAMTDSKMYKEMNNTYMMTRDILWL